MTDRKRDYPVTPASLRPWFHQAEVMYSLPEGALEAIALVESNFDPKAMAPQYSKAGVHTGGKGLMQFVSSTARAYGIDPFDPKQSIFAAAKYLRRSLDTSNNDIKFTINSFNKGWTGAKREAAGDTTVAGDPQYVSKVMRALDHVLRSRIQTTGSTRPPYVPQTVKEAHEVISTPAPEPGPLDSYAQFVGPTTPGWQDTIDVNSMMAKLTSYFDDTNAEYAQLLNENADDLDKLLDPYEVA